MGDDPRRVAGQRLKIAIHVARARAALTSDIQVAGRSGVHYDTLMNWFSGKTTPRGHELRKVADALGVPYVDLEGAYEGREPEPPPLVDAVRTLIGEVTDLVKELREDRERGQDAAAAILRAAEIVGSLPRRPRGGASTEPPVPDGSAG